MHHRDLAITDDTQWITTRVAAAALGLKPRQVRGFISEGRLEARTEGEGANKRYLVSAAGVEALRAERREEYETPEQNLESEENVAAVGDPEEPAHVLTSVAELLRELTTDLSEARYLLGRAEASLELSTRAEGVLKEQLRQERERVARLEAERDRLLPDMLRERDLANAQRERAEHFEAELREALEARRGWFRRFFGF